MRHAVLVIGYGTNPAVLQGTIQHLDVKDIDFFIHWDKRFPLPQLKSKHSQITFIKNRIAVKWGSSSQIIATKKLLSTVLKSVTNYDYVHLISCNDIPLMTPTYFKTFFTKDFYVGSSSRINDKTLERIKYWYPKNMDFRKHNNLKRLFTLGNKVFRINRCKNYKNLVVKKGPQWFSLRTDYIPEILKFDDSIFLHGYCVDELFIQTILSTLNYQIREDGADDNQQAARYIDWDRGIPYVFEETDIAELKKIVNTEFAFARKVKNPAVITKLWH